MIQLHLHTKYSLLDAMIGIDALGKKLKEQGQTKVALTEHGNVYSAVEALMKLKKEGIDTILGCEVYICDNAEVNDKDNKYYHLILLCKDETGRNNLNWLVSESTKHRYYGKPRIDFGMLEQHHEGLVCLSACMAGEIQRALAGEDFEKAEQIALKYKNLFGEDYYLEYQSHRNDEQQRLNKAVVELAIKLGIEYVVTTDAHYLNKEDQKYHSMFVQIGSQREVGETYDDCYVQTEDEVKEICWMTRKYNDRAIRNTHIIADKCTNTIPLSAPIMPHVDVPEKFTNEKSYISDLCNKGFKEKGFKDWTLEQWKSYMSDLPEGSDVIPPDCKTAKDYRDIYIKRARYEMDAIDEMGFIGYYLLVHSYGNSVKRRGLARGSGAGSLLAYLCNIVDVDPVKYKLYFERFIDVGALDLLRDGTITKKELKVPDFDLDFSPSERDKVLGFITNKYGEDHVVNLGQFSYIWAKGAIKDIGKVLGIPFETTNEITKQLDAETIDEALESGVLDKYKDQYPQLFEYASALSGLPKSFGVHPCGVCVCVEPAMHYNAIEYNDKQETWVLQGDMHTAEDLGLVKIDLLGLRTLDAIYDTLELIGKDYQYITPTKLDLHDEAVWKEFKTGNTTCIFQFESQGMRQMLKDMKCDSIENLSAANALYRPGAKQYIDNYVKRKKGLEEITYLNDDLKPILANTYGIIVFQEQLIEIGRLAGLRNPDELRKATAKKKPELMAKIEPELKNGLMNRGWTQEQVDTLWDTILKFAKYSFNKCVSADTRLLLPDGRLSPTVAEMAEDESLIPEFGLSKFRSRICPNKIVSVTLAGERFFYEIETENGCKVRCTPNHKVPTANGTVTADEIEIGDLLYTLPDFSFYDDKGLKYKLSKVVRVTLAGKGQTYDVEMAAPAHNFVTGDGMVVCNSHSTAYALTAYISMYLKIHHPLEFFASMINSYEDTKDIAKCVAEGRRTGVKFVIDKWDEAQNIATRKDGVVHLGLSSFKGFGSAVATSLKEAHNEFAQGEDQSFHKVVELCKAHGINDTQIRTMVKLGMFELFGKSETLLEMLEYETILSRSQYDKATCPYPVETMRRFSKECAKQFRELDAEGLYGYLCSQLKDRDITAGKLMQAQLETLGYILYEDKQTDARYAVIVEADTKFTPTLELYNIKTGKQNVFKINKTKTRRPSSQKIIHTSFYECPVGVGDIIYISEWECLQKQKRLDDGKFVPVPNAFEKWITDYYKVTAY